MDPYEHPGCVCWPCKWWWEWCPCQKWPIFFFCQSSWTISGCVTHHIALWTFALWTCGRNDTVVLENNKGLGIKLIIFDNHLAVREQSQWEDTHSHHQGWVLSHASEEPQRHCYWPRCGTAICTSATYTKYMLCYIYTICNQLCNTTLHQEKGVWSQRNLGISR